MYVVLMAEFGGKSDRWVTIAESGRQKAVSGNRESASNKRMADSLWLIADGGLRNLGCWIAGRGDTEMG